MIAGCSTPPANEPGTRYHPADTDSHGIQAITNYRVGNCGFKAERYDRSSKDESPGTLGASCEDPSKHYSVHYRLGFLEYGSGKADPYTENQLKGILTAINAVKQRPLYLVVFVHGWRNDARETGDEGNDLSGFKALLAKRAYELANGELKPGEAFDVLGVFVGWRGSAGGGLLNDILHFKDKSNLAAQIGAPSGSLREHLSKIAHKVGEHHPHSRLLVMGHSLGASVLAYAFAASPAQLGTHTTFVTINPAVPASVFSSAMQQDCGKKDQSGKEERLRPSWVNITSKDDRTTGWLFPLVTRFNRYDANPVDYQAIGHHEPYVSGEITVEDAQQCSGSPQEIAHRQEAARQFWRKDGGLLRYVDLVYQYKDCNNQRNYCASTFTLKRRSEQSSGPVWNIQVDKDIINSVQPSLTGTHSAFVQTYLGRLIDQLVFGDLFDQKKERVVQQRICPLPTKQTQ